MSKNLVIVESPAKAKTIEGYLGKEYTVRSSYGHVRDLPKDDKAVDIANNYEPHYEISEEKRQVVSELRRLAQQSEVIWLATDDDREGEAISWHLKEALGLDDRRTKRIVFREITKKAIQNAIQNPRTINYDLVNAQQARRVLDRIVGFELSPLLWKKIKGGLSAGRVQSVAARIVVEREREIRDFRSEAAYKVKGFFLLDNGKTLIADLNRSFKTRQEAQDFLEQCKPATFEIEAIEKKPAKRSPAPPFTTSTLQQEASRKLGFSVSATMTVAQKLYENGYISYMRTDSVNLSDDAVASASATIKGQYGDDYLHVRHYRTKSAGAQEAHEAIRPTDFGRQHVPGDPADQKLYDLIWKRAIASQMADAVLEKTTATIRISTQPHKFVATGEVIKFDGFLKVYVESTDDDDQKSGEEENKGVLPPLSIGQPLGLDAIRARERFTAHPPRYTEASLVKKLEEMGIGRPSTYAPTISTIIKREYVVKESREGTPRQYHELTLRKGQIQTETKTEIIGTEKNKLFPTHIGEVVNDFLVKHFTSVVDFHFTAKVEEEFDHIAHGQIEWKTMIDRFYHEFHPTVTATEQADRASIGIQKSLGTDPVSGAEVLVKSGKYGPYVQIGPAEQKHFASLRKNQRLESITLEQALELFKLPREVGEFEGLKMITNDGKFGPYVKHGDKFVSLEKHQDPLTLTHDEAVALIQAKRKAEADRIIRKFDEDPDLQILNGKWGPYIAYKKQNGKIPKGTDPASLSYDECMALLNASKTAATAKLTKNALKTFEQDPDIIVLSGRFGPYILYQDQNYNLPKGQKAEDLTFEQAKDIIAAKQQKAAPAKKAPAKAPTKKKS